MKKNKEKKILLLIRSSVLDDWSVFAEATIDWESATFCKYKRYVGKSFFTRTPKYRCGFWERSSSYEKIEFIKD